MLDVVADRSDDTVRVLSLAAERLDDLADTAELMGDDETMTEFRRRAAQHRSDALDRLDRLDGVREP